MLFNEQLEELEMKDGDVFHVLAAFFVDSNTIGELISIKDTKGAIRVQVHYHVSGASKPEIKLVKEGLKPAEFEKLLAQIAAMTIGNNLGFREFSYRTRTIDSPHTAWFDKEEYELFTYTYLYRTLMDVPRSDIYDELKERINILTHS